MLGGRSSHEWIAEYSQSHQHPVNRFCHTLGIPLIALSIPFVAGACFVEGPWPVPVAMFVIGWILQFAGRRRRQAAGVFSRTRASCSWGCAGGSRTFADAPSGGLRATSYEYRSLNHGSAVFE